jgi:L-lactate dehydrogenase complex protein LldE
MNVALFITCVADQLFVRLLRRLGCSVSFPEAQACCGQPAFNSGYADDARAAALALLDAFEDAEYVVSPSGSCVGMIHHYYPQLFAGDSVLAERAQRFASKTYELSQFIVGVLGVTDVGAEFQHTVTYHASCHASRLLGAREEPLELLRAVKQLELVPLPRCEDCCGFGGAFSVKLADISSAMVDEKVAHIESTEAPFVVSTDLGCLMNIQGRLDQRGSRTRAVHLAEILESTPEDRGAKP